MEHISASKRLREFMDIYNLRQADIIEKTGISSSCLSSYLSGKREPKSDKIGLIASAYNVNPMWLMGFDSKMEKDNIETMAEIDAEITNTPIELKEYMLKLANMNSENQKAVKDFIDFCLSKNN